MLTYENGYNCCARQIKEKGIDVIEKTLSEIISPETPYEDLNDWDKGWDAAIRNYKNGSLIIK